MSTLYTPDSAINSTFVVQLSQRDLSSRVPVNYVNHPGVVLQAACFGSRRYEEAAAAKCFSNLLVSGFRRIEADVFWDASRWTWSLCPVELGGAEGLLTSSTSVDVAAPSRAPTTPISELLTDRDVALGSPHARRADGEVLSQSSAASTTVTASTSLVSTATLIAEPAATSVIGGSPSPNSDFQEATLIRVGRYACTTSADFALLVSILSAHMKSTDTNIEATTVTLTLNVHAAASAADPDGPAQAPPGDRMPPGDSLLSTVLAGNISTFLYTPSNLLNQRRNLNSSGGWFAVYSTLQPVAEYLTIDENGDSASSPNGWPSEGFVEIPGYAKRMLVGFGDVDPQMAGYNFSGDSSTIFPPGYLESNNNVTLTSSGNIATGCFFDAEETTLANVNSSWASSSVGSGDSVPAERVSTYLEQARNLTACGISPILNATIGNVSADQDFELYVAFAQSTVWSWGPGQPGNSSDDLTNARCAALNATSGAWRALDCSESRYGACRVSNELYDWQVSSSDAPYHRVELACDEGEVFDTPRTALENRYLLAAWREFRDEKEDDDIDELLWLNFNDIDVESCWVVGQNTTCPYNGPQQQESQRIVVPVVGGVIVFVLTALTMLVKCAGNRQTSKRRRRRGEDGWDYEGVPA